MKKYLVAVLVAVCCSPVAIAQQYPKPPIEAKDKLTGQNQPTLAKPGQSKFVGFSNPPSDDLKWQASLSKISANESDNDELLEKIKNIKNKAKFHDNIPSQPAAKTTVAAPSLGANFYGLNNGGTNTPLDNTIAISNAGIIVAFVNHKIGYYTTTGTLTYSKDLYTLINDATLTNSICDPKVIYDNTADRFIFYSQVCDAMSAHSFVIIGFSKTNDPSAGWFFYEFTGNPLNDLSWFDYPKMAISNDELFVTGNLFYDAGGYNQSVIYQLDKAQGYAGAASVSWQFWSGVTGFTILPVSYGQTGSYGPGIYLVSTAGTTSGSSNIHLYEITNNIASGTAVLNSYNVPTPTYSNSGDAAQSGTTRLLNTGDCRSLDGFYLNGIIHFVYNTDAGSGYCGASYNRLTVSSATNVSATFANVGNTDICYPAIASASNSVTDASVIMAFNESGSGIFPRTCAVTCDNSMAWSAPLIVRNGDTYVHYSWATTSTDRWGDYNGMCRKYNSSPAVLWMAGMYGSVTASHIWSQWIAQLSQGVISGISANNTEESKVNVYPNPVVENFDVVFSAEQRQQVTISLFDAQGKLVANLYTGIVEAGKNMFSFNKAGLAKGSYVLNIKGITSSKNEKVIIN